MAATRSKEKFLCGVVEGFYGRPWSTEQRLDLFSCISRLGMNCYLYAPKDDDKHRAIWREMYLQDEADHLSMLIRETASRRIEFIYAIAPGLDITFSNEKDLTALKNKLNQIKDLGCRSFAILFDDIDPDLSQADAKAFTSSANAQAAIANEIYYHLQEPQIFLFCPTEYCGSRALPNVKESQYLSHIGKTLNSNIDIMWTGPKVISRNISLTSIEEVSEVLCRPPVIWDNLHANDYDQRRLFLGPYEGRSTSLIPKLNGVLTNPNCEYGANYVAIHTLAQWSRCGPRNDGMEIVNFYNPKDALNVALIEWMAEFQSDKRKCEDYLPTKSSKSVSRATDMDQIDDKSETGSGMLTEEDEDGKERASSTGSSDMDTTPEGGVNGENQLFDSSVKNNSFNLEDLHVLVDYFYLPHVHGDKGQLLLEEFSWLKQNAPGYHLLKRHSGNSSSSDEGEKPDKVRPVVERSDGEEVSDESHDEDELSHGDQMSEVMVWLDRATNFHTLCEEVNHCFNHLTEIPNRPLLYDLYQYMSDARETTMLLDSYISWLEAGGDEVGPKHKPHAKMGGIIAEMLRQLPQVHSASKLHHRCKAPPIPLSKSYVIRPYRPEDKELLYQTCLETGSDGKDAVSLFPNYPDVLGDRFVGPYLTLSSDLSFVLEDNEGVCGYVLAALDSSQFYHEFRTKWRPQIVGKYPIITQTEHMTPEQEMLIEIHNPKLFLPESLKRLYPSHLHIDIMKRGQGQGNGPHMIKTIISILKAKGSHGVHLEMSAHNKRALKFYLKLGFEVLDYSNESLDGDVLILGRVL